MIPAIVQLAGNKVAMTGRRIGPSEKASGARLMSHGEIIGRKLDVSFAVHEFVHGLSESQFNGACTMISAAPSRKASPIDPLSQRAGKEFPPGRKDLPR